MKHNQKGFAHLLLLLSVIVVSVVLAVGYFVSTKSKETNSETATPQSDQKVASTSCPDPVLQSPVDLTKVTSILYPGQTRGGYYKPHGGFRLDNLNTNEIEIKAPMDATLTAGSRYIEQNETQYLLDFKAECGVNYRFDHLLTLSAKIQSEVEKLPAPQKDDSRTTNFNNQITVKAGEVIATAVGFKQKQNVSFDFGVYDTRQPNTASKESAYRSTHPDVENSEQLKYAVCWFDYLTKTDSELIKSLPPADQNAGKTSDYCK